MTMFLKTGEHLSIENPTVEQFSQIFSNLKKESYCLSEDRRVGSTYSEHAKNLLNIKRKTVTTYQVSVQEHKSGTEAEFKTLVSTVDLSNAVKIAHTYSLNDESWRGMSEWQESEESLFGIFKGFLEIVVKPSKWAIISFIVVIFLGVGVFLVLKNNFSISGYFKSQNSLEKTGGREYIIGDVVQNKSFAYRVNGIQFSNRVGNLFIGQDAGEGNKFLIIDVEIKNIDTESRMIDEGEVRTSYNGKWLKFESPEPVLSDDFITFDVLNPLISVRGKVAFKVPAQLEGPFYWIPPRTNGRIKLTTQRDDSAQMQNKKK